MKYKCTFFVISFLLLINSCYAVEDNDKQYYAIEINGVVCGYTEMIETDIEKNGSIYKNEKLDMLLMLSLFGSEFNTEMGITSLVDPVTKKCLHLKGNIKQGTIKTVFEVNIKNDVAEIKSSLMAEPKIINLNENVLFGSDEVYKNVKKEFVQNNATEVSFDILEAVDGEIQNSTFRRIGQEKIKLVGKTFETIVVEQQNNKTGIKIKYWIDPALDYYAMFKVLNRKIYLADHTVVDKIKVANMDASILTKTNVAISDVQAINYMKMKVEIQPTGVNLKPEDLNLSGQKFNGTIEGNLIKGIIEVQQEKYSGDNSPPFPPDFSNEESLVKYLKPSGRIESNDPILVDEAKNITDGAKDSWEAAVRLSNWVATKIHYAIPGGGSALGTYNMKAGECGGHSMLLTAFCRAVGIPARVVFGGMYVPNKGGAFGQHAWNEIYMGDAGWIPVDATAFETDFMDAGHIRISEHLLSSSSFNAKSIEIIDYRLRNKDIDNSAELSEMYVPYLGKYTNKESGKTFEVVKKEGNLCVDIPGQMVLPFNNQDEHGRWYCKLSNKLYIEFSKDDNEKINQMLFHELVSMSKQSDTAGVNFDVPDKFKPYVGNYFFPAINAVFKVEFSQNSLSVYDPTKNKTVMLQLPEENGGWVDEFNKNTIFFETNADGNVTALNINARTLFEKE